MGAAQSSAFSMTKLVNESLTSVLLENSMGCTGSTSTLQEITIGDMDIKYCKFNISDINQDAKVTLNLDCAQNSTNETDLQSKFSTKLTEDLEAKIKNLNIGLNSTDTTSLTDATNIIKNEINVKNVATCIANQMLTQKMTIGKFTVECLPGDSFNINNINQTIISSTVTKCIQDNANVTKAINDIQNIIDKRLKSVVEGIDPTISSVISVVLSFIVLGIASSVVSVVMNNKKKAI